MKAALVLLLCLAAPSWAQDGDNRYPISADTVRHDSDSGVTTYEGNAKAEVENLVIEAETISIFHGDGLPSRIEASGSPIKFRREATDGNLNGTARQIIFVIPELKLTLIDYFIADPDGNKLKGRKATFVLNP